MNELRNTATLPWGGVDIEMTQDGGTGVDRQAVVHEVGGEQAAEVVRGEPARTNSGCSTGSPPELRRYSASGWGS